MAKIGVLALQGDFKEHIDMLKNCKVAAEEVRLPRDLQNIDGLIIPGGESTTIGKLMCQNKLDQEIIKKHNQGMAIYSTCAGAILLSKSISGSSQPRLNLLDISIKRNDYGRQVDSFEAELSIEKFLGHIHQILNVLNRFCKHFFFFIRQLQLNYFLNAASSQLDRHSDKIPSNAVFGAAVGGARQNSFLVFQN